MTSAQNERSTYFNARPFDLRMAAIFLFLVSTILGLVLGALIGAFSFKPDAPIHMAVFLAIGLSAHALLYLVVLFLWWHYSMVRLPERCGNAYALPAGVSEGSTQWRRYTLRHTNLSTRGRVVVWFKWAVYQPVRLADFVFSRGLPPPSYAAPAAHADVRMEEGVVDSEVRSRSARASLEDDVKTRRKARQKTKTVQWDEPMHSIRVMPRDEEDEEDRLFEEKAAAARRELEKAILKENGYDSDGNTPRHGWHVEQMDEPYLPREVPETPGPRPKLHQRPRPAVADRGRSYTSGSFSARNARPPSPEEEPRDVEYEQYHGQT